MRKSSFSSLILWMALAVSCQEKAPNASVKEEAPVSSEKSMEEGPAKAERQGVQSAVPVNNSDLSEKPEQDKASEHEVHEHGSPNQSEIDSIKAAKLKGKK